jgi:hypothetical protein
MSASPNTRASDSKRLLEQIDDGDSIQQGAAIDQLLALAEHADDPDIWNNAALGLHRLQRFEEVDIFVQLVEKFPSTDIHLMRAQERRLSMVYATFSNSFS